MYTSTAVLGKCASETITSAATLAKATPSRSSCAPRSIAKTEHQNAKHGLPFDVWCIGRAFVLWCLALHCVGRILQGLHGAPESAGRRPARGCGSGRAEINYHPAVHNAPSALQGRDASFVCIHSVFPFRRSHEQTTSEGVGWE